jgi:hypothetical protein
VSREPQLRKLARVARWTSARLRCRGAVERIALLLPLPLLYAVLALTVIKSLRLGAELAQAVMLGVLLPAAVFFVGVMHALLERRPKHEGALALDRHHGLRDRLTNALSFAELPPTERTPLMQAAIDDAVQAASGLRPRKAAPFPWPRELAVALGLGAALFGLSLLEVRVSRPDPPVEGVTPVALAPDDLDLLREDGRELERTVEDTEALAAVRRYNQLVQDIADQRLDRREVFDRLKAIERELSQSVRSDREALEQGLSALARELERSELSRPVARAIQSRNLEDAEQALRELAEKLRDQRKVDKSELERLRDALERASQATTEQLKAVDARRQELQAQKKRLLKKKQEQKLDPRDQRELEQTERRLERLERERKAAEQATRQMSELDRKLAEAAQRLMQQAGESAERLEQAAQEMSQSARREMSDSEKERLLQKLNELEQLLRQQGQGGEERGERMQRFGRRARGQSPQGGDQQGDGANAPGQRPGDGPVRLGPGSGQRLPLPQAGVGSDPRPGGSGEQGAGVGMAGKEWGTGHDPSVQGEATKLDGRTRDVAAAGVDSGEGTASAEVIYGAADRGFVGRGYRKVYTDYRAVAERNIERDEIPPGYKFYVQRYFQLIRPRE